MCLRPFFALIPFAIHRIYFKLMCILFSFVGERRFESNVTAWNLIYHANLFLPYGLAFSSQFLFSSFLCMEIMKKLTFFWFNVFCWSSFSVIQKSKGRKKSKNTTNSNDKCNIIWSCCQWKLPQILEMALIKRLCNLYLCTLLWIFGIADEAAE